AKPAYRHRAAMDGGHAANAGAISGLGGNRRSHKYASSFLPCRSDFSRDPLIPSPLAGEGQGEGVIKRRHIIPLYQLMISHVRCMYRVCFPPPCYSVSSVVKSLFFYSLRPSNTASGQVTVCRACGSPQAAASSVSIRRKGFSPCVC